MKTLNSTLQVLTHKTTTTLLKFQHLLLLFLTFLKIIRSHRGYPINNRRENNSNTHYRNHSFHVTHLNGDTTIILSMPPTLTPTSLMEWELMGTSLTLQVYINKNMLTLNLQHLRYLSLIIEETTQACLESFHISPWIHLMIISQPWLNHSFLSPLQNQL